MCSWFAFRDDNVVLHAKLYHRLDTGASIDCEEAFILQIVLEIEMAYFA